MICQRARGTKVEEVNLEDEDDMQEAISLSNKVNSYLVQLLYDISMAEPVIVNNCAIFI